MARYTSSYLTSLSPEQVPAVMDDLLKQACNCDVIYSTNDYIMAKENPGNVPFPKLVNIEVLIDSTLATGKSMRINFVVKNEELPLQIGNHCEQVFQQLQQAIAENQSQWQRTEEAMSSAS